jgi:hypothetical protein
MRDGTMTKTGTAMKSLAYFLVLFMLAAGGLAKAGETKPRTAKPAASAKPTKQQLMLEKFDTNGNGKLDPDERSAAMQASKERRSQKKKDAANEGNLGQPGSPGDPNAGIGGLGGQPLGGGGTAGTGGDGRAKLLQRFDTNRDGILSAQEMQQAQAAMQQMRQPGQLNGGNLPPGGAPPGVGGPNVNRPPARRQ